MSSLMELSFFQFNNLLTNRVPFVLISYDVDFKNFTTGIFQSHLEKHLVHLKPNETAPYLEKQNFSKEQSMVLVCNKGDVSKKIAIKLEKSGYKNVFIIAGGYELLLSEKN